MSCLGWNKALMHSPESFPLLLPFGPEGMIELVFGKPTDLDVLILGSSLVFVVVVNTEVKPGFVLVLNKGIVVCAMEESYMEVIDWFVFKESRA